MNYIKKFERVVVVSLIMLMSILVIISILNVAFSIFTLFTLSMEEFFDANRLRELFGLVLLVVVGLELLDTIKAYIKDDIVHAEVVVLAAVIGLANKVIVLDLSHTEPLTIFALAGLIVSLAVCYYFLKEKTVAKTREQAKDLPEKQFRDGKPG